MHAQNSLSTVVHGRTTVEDGSNGLTVSIFSQFLSTLPDAFTHLHRRKATAKNSFNVVVLMLKINETA